MTEVFLLCAVIPTFGCVPFDTLEACENARDQVSAIIELVGCEVADLDHGSPWAPEFAPLPPVRPASAVEAGQ